MVDRHYTHPKLAQLYNGENGWSPDREFYIRFVGPPKKTVLDVGCGTGLIACRLARNGHDAVGIDPAKAMLDIARQTPGGDLVDWHLTTAQEFDLDRRFDRIFMTGNAFQVLLTESDVLAAFRNWKKHLAPSGRIAFESRNPALDWPARWNYETTIETDVGPVREDRRCLSYDPPFLHFRFNFKFESLDAVLHSESTLRFWSREEIEACLTATGLRVTDLYGGWNYEPLNPKQSEEMIFLVEAA